MSFFKISGLFVAFSLMSSNFVQAAPTLSAAALLKNGQAAQGLNKQFLGVKATDSCSGQEIACISGAIASCVSGKWDVDTGRCSKSQNCFAVPSVARDGIELMCTSEKNAVSLIDSTGATGGVTGDGGSTPGGNGDEPLGSDSVSSSTIAATPSSTASNSADISATPSLTLVSTTPAITSASVSVPQQINDPPTSGIPSTTPATASTPTTDSVSASAPTDIDTASPTNTTPAVTNAPQAPVVTITERVTVTVMPAMQTTLAPVTRTLSPDEVISVLSSLMKQRASTDVPAPSNSPAATPLTDSAAQSAITDTPIAAPTPVTTPGPGATINPTATPATDPYGPY